MRGDPGARRWPSPRGGRAQSAVAGTGNSSPTVGRQRTCHLAIEVGGDRRRNRPEAGPRRGIPKNPGARRSVGDLAGPQPVLLEPPVDLARREGAGPPVASTSTADALCAPAIRERVEPTFHVSRRRSGGRCHRAPVLSRLRVVRLWEGLARVVEPELLGEDPFAMTFEPGGYAEKAGNQYETEWFVLQLLRVLLGQLRSAQWEPPVQEADGDVVVELPDGTLELQQCRGSAGAPGKWRIAVLEKSRVLRQLESFLSKHPSHRFALVSPAPTEELGDLTQSARDSADPESYFSTQEGCGRHRCEALRGFCAALDLDPCKPEHRARAWDRLRRSRCSVQDRPGETLRTLAMSVVEGDPEIVIATLAEVARDRLRTRFYAETLWEVLERRGLRRAILRADPDLHKKIERLRGEFVRSVESQLAGGRLTSRAEAARAMDALLDVSRPRTVVIHGRAGTGKSVVLLEILQSLRDREIPHLVLRLDRQRPERSEDEWGRDLGLPSSPVRALRAIAGSRTAVLVLDQLDALRWTATGASRAWDICAGMIRAAHDIGSMRVLVACRSFDLETDPQVAAWKQAEHAVDIPIGEFRDSEVEEVVRRCGIRFDAVALGVRRALRLPLNLALWVKLAQSAPDRVHPTETPALVDQFIELTWKSVEKQLPGLSIEGVLAPILDYMDEHSTVHAPARHVADSTIRNALLSAGILNEGASGVVLAHQAYFECLSARRILDKLRKDQSGVRTWLGDRHRQSLFRREQLRSLLVRMRREEPADYANALQELIFCEGIRFHLRRVVLEVLREVDEPNGIEKDLVRRMMECPALRDHVLWEVAAGRQCWVAMLIEKRWVTGALRTSGDVATALALLRSVADELGDAIADCIEPLAADDDWARRAVQVLPFNPGKDTDRLFAFRSGLQERGFAPPYTDWKELAQQHPTRCIRLAAALLAWERKGPSAGAGHLARRGDSPWSDYELPFVESAASRDPRSAWDVFTAHARTLESQAELPEFVERVLVASGKRLAAEPADFLQEVAGLSGSIPSLPRVIAKCLVGAPLEASDLVIRWLIEDPVGHWRVGDLEEGKWSPARALLDRFCAHCSEGAMKEFERSVLTCGRLPRRGRASPRQWFVEAQFALLSAVPPTRLSAEARGRLGVLVERYREQAGRILGPRKRPEVSRVTSPIGPERLLRLSDVAWRRLMRKRNLPRESDPRPGDGRGWVESSVAQFAADVRSMARRQPERFARLALELPADVCEEFASAILDGLSQEAPPDGLAAAESAAWRRADADLACRVATHLSSSGTESVFRSLCRVVESIPAAMWSESVVDRIAHAAMHHIDPRLGDPPPQMSPQRDDDGLYAIETHAINCTRGIAAGALAALLEADASRLPRIAPAIWSLALDPHAAVRVAGVRAIAAMVRVEPEAGLDLFVRCAESGDERIPCTHVAQHAINFLRARHLPRLAPLFARMRLSALSSVALAGSAHSTAAWFETGELWEEVDACLHGTAAQRRGVAEVAAHWVRYPEHRASCFRVLKALLDDADEGVRSAISSVFQSQGALEWSECATFALRYVRSPAFRESPMWLLHSLEQHTGSLLPIADVVLEVCGVFSTELGEASRDFSTTLAADARSVPRVLLRLLEESDKLDVPSERLSVMGRCLDALDGLLEARVSWAATVFEELRP